MDEDTVKTKPSSIRSAAFLSIVTFSIFFYSLGSIVIQKIYGNAAVEIKVNSSLIKQSYNNSMRANAVILVLASNRDSEPLLDTLVQFEERFNKMYNYPYVFLMEEPFHDGFKEDVTQLIMKKYGQNGTAKHRTRNVTFALIPAEHWAYPEWLNLKMTEENKALYEIAESKRYFSGFFYRHPALQQYDFFWRVEPGAQFFCNLDYDPFVLMLETNKTYGFVQIMPEIAKPVKLLWDTSKKFLKDVYLTFKDQLSDYPSLRLLLDEDLPFPSVSESGYLKDTDDLNWLNGCHFWSNFEIARFDFFRSYYYQRYFDYLDKTGGFFYEKWDDALIHSLAVGIFLEKSQIHHFSDVGYSYDDLPWCPAEDVRLSGDCSCNANDPENTAYPERMEGSLCIGLVTRFDSDTIDNDT